LFVRLPVRNERGRNVEWYGIAAESGSQAAKGLNADAESELRELIEKLRRQ